MQLNARNLDKSLINKSYVDYAASNKIKLIIGTSDPDKWVKYLKENHPDCKFKIIGSSILINPET